MDKVVHDPIYLNVMNLGTSILQLSSCGTLFIDSSLQRWTKTVFPTCNDLQNLNPKSLVQEWQGHTFVSGTGASKESGVLMLEVTEVPVLSMIEGFRV